MKLTQGLAAFVLAATAWTTASASSMGGAVQAPIAGAIAAANADNGSALNAYFAPNAVVVDEFAPFVWSGKNAAKHWWAAMDSSNAAAHITAMHVALQEITQANVTHAGAYVVVRLAITWRDHGKPYREIGLWALTLHPSANDWKIVSASWATASITSD